MQSGVRDQQCTWGGRGGGGGGGFDFGVSISGLGGSSSSGGGFGNGDSVYLPPLASPSLMDIALNPILDAAPGDPANDANPSVPKPQNPILQYDKCATNIRNQAKANRKIVSTLQQVSFGNELAACGATGPDAPLCIGAISAVNGTVSVVNWGAYFYNVWNGESKCLLQ